MNNKIATILIGLTTVIGITVIVTETTTSLPLVDAPVRTVDTAFSTSAEFDGVGDSADIANLKYERVLYKGEYCRLYSDGVNASSEVMICPLMYYTNPY
jgi:hypothetical protein